jgi:hypothetical protein
MTPAGHPLGAHSYEWTRHEPVVEPMLRTHPLLRAIIDASRQVRKLHERDYVDLYHLDFAPELALGERPSTVSAQQNATRAEAASVATPMGLVVVATPLVPRGQRLVGFDLTLRSWPDKGPITGDVGLCPRIRSSLIYRYIHRLLVDSKGAYIHATTSLLSQTVVLGYEAPRRARVPLAPFRWRWRAVAPARGGNECAAEALVGAGAPRSHGS